MFNYLICNFVFASFCNILTKISILVFFVKSYIACLLNNSNNKDIIANNIKIIANNNKQ